MEDFTVGDSSLFSLSGLELWLAFQINVSGQQDTLIDIVVQSLDRHIQFRMIGKDVIGRLSLHDQGLNDAVHLTHLSSGLVNPLS